jgi:hypothetical protein
MGRRTSRHLAIGASVILMAWLVPGAATAEPVESEADRAALFCTWGGTPLDTTGTVTIRPGLTFTPATQPLDFVASGRAECSDGFVGRVTFDGIIQAGGTCAALVFEGKVRGLPGVTRFYGPGLGGVVHEFLYDADGNVVGTDQPQVLSGVGQGSEASDCNTEKGFTDAVFSSTIELWG